MCAGHTNLIFTWSCVRFPHARTCLDQLFHCDTHTVAISVSCPLLESYHFPISWNWPHICGCSDEETLPTGWPGFLSVVPEGHCGCGHPAIMTWGSPSHREVFCLTERLSRSWFHGLAFCAVGPSLRRGSMLDSIFPCRHLEILNEVWTRGQSGPSPCQVADFFFF